MAQEKEYGLLIAAIVAIVSIVGLVILFSRGNPTGGVIVVTDAPWCYSPLDPKNSWTFVVELDQDEVDPFNSDTIYNPIGRGDMAERIGTCVPSQSMFEYKVDSVVYYPVFFPNGKLFRHWESKPEEWEIKKLPSDPRTSPHT